MYQIEGWGDVLKRRGALVPRRLAVSRNVVYLGLTSLFTDISSEMVSTVLPVYIVFYLQLSTLQFGVVDGLYQGAAALVRAVGGLSADRWRRHKEVAAAGYAVSTVSKLGLLAAGGAWGGLAGAVFLDRLGKGVRTAPRDALISLSTPRTELATAFGVHRALDTTGAMLGPLVAFSLLALAPNAFDAVFVTSFCAALVGVGVLALFVENRPTLDQVGKRGAVSLRAAAELLRAPRFRALVIAGTALSLATLSDGFVYLGLQRRLAFAAGFLPLLYVGTAFTYLALAVPAGRVADRLGRGRMFLGGYLLLAVVYTALLLPMVGIAELIGCLLLLGAYYAATDGVLMALASAVLPSALRASGLALLTTATGLSRLLASVLFGALWTWWGVETALVVILAGLSLAILLAALALVRTRISAANEQALAS